MYLATKENRLKSQQIQIERLLKEGYTQENYNDLQIFTVEQQGKFYLKIFKGTASNHMCYYVYRTAERMNEAVKQYKESSDRNKAYKAELKANPRKSSAANCAAAIREELKKEFPGIKFSVTSENFSMGDSVDIRWNDGPTTSEVEKFTSKYQYGHFNGMNDMYENTNCREDIPQAKYIMESRSMSNETRDFLLPFAEKLFTGAHWQGHNGIHNAENFLHRIFYASPIPAGATITGIEDTGVTCGAATPDNFYRIGYSLPVQTIEETKQTVAPIETKAGEVSVIEYSEKAIAVIGDTKPIKDKLKELGGKFNFRLSCGAGWIFPKTKLNDLQKLLGA